VPVNPSAPYDTGAQILAMVQDLCKDPQGQLFTAVYCLSAINSAARWLAQELRNNDKMTLIEDEYLVTIPAVTASDAAQQVYLTFTGISGDVTAANTPTLPQDLIEPLVLWERPSNQKMNLLEMRNTTGAGGLPKRFQRSRLSEWEWRTDMICFVGALEATDVIIRYAAAAVAPFTIDNNGFISGSLVDINGIDAVSYRAASQLIPKRGGAALGAYYEQQAQMFLEKLATDATRQQQMSPVRMRPYGRLRSRGSRWL
jgi:hypothetical protein